MSYFESLLIRFLIVCHPQLVDDSLFIFERSDEAFSIYRELLERGVKEYAAYDLAIAVLFDEL
ncbi:DUF1896 family protein [Dysgonomonas sp. ZJ709]|uniref:DUF1896 family protein n=1 Tax=Dysgonomonas sp. ZJ709 TaxID=2709797 RepID=UPI0013EB2AF4|nr:DUF1896 family protein [Dysgonomonas sp. ZJ709]